MICFSVSSAQSFSLLLLFPFVSSEKLAYKPRIKTFFGNPAKGKPLADFGDASYPQDQNGRSISPADTLDEVGYPRTNRPVLSERRAVGVLSPEENAVARPTKSPPPVLMPRPMHAIAPTRNLVLNNLYGRPASSTSTAPAVHPASGSRQQASNETDHSCESDYGDAKESAFTPLSEMEPSLTSASNSEGKSIEMEKLETNPDVNSGKPEGILVFKSSISSDAPKKISFAGEASAHVSSPSSPSSSSSITSTSKSSLEYPPQIIRSPENSNTIMRSRRTSTVDSSLPSHPPSVQQTVPKPTIPQPEPITKQDDVKVSKVIEQENSILRQQLDQLIQERDEQKQLEDEHKRRIDQMFDKVKELEGQLRRVLNTSVLSNSKSTPTSVGKQAQRSPPGQRSGKNVTHGEIRHRIIPRIDELEEQPHSILIERPRRKSLVTRPSSGNLRRVSLSQEPLEPVVRSGQARSRSRSRSRDRHRASIPDEDVPYYRRESVIRRPPIEPKYHRRRSYLEDEDEEYFSAEDDAYYAEEYHRNPRHSTPGLYRRPSVERLVPLTRRRSVGSYPRRSSHGAAHNDDYERVYVARVAVREPNVLRRRPSNKNLRHRESYVEEHHPRTYHSTQTRKHGSNVHYL
ncbi:hypothetical protein NQZ79_g2822 [Umbelopsis isabellina]|nr:hypothetical protein NQZ79_g2822 [Umbelopsis isabellina]